MQFSLVSKIETISIHNLFIKDLVTEKLKEHIDNHAAFNPVNKHFILKQAFNLKPNKRNHLGILNC